MVRAPRRSEHPAGRRSPAGAADPAPRATPDVAGRPPDAIDLRWPLGILAATFVYPLLESAFWSRTLWGANALAFLPFGWWLVSAACGLLFVPRIADGLGERLARWR